MNAKQRLNPWYASWIVRVAFLTSLTFAVGTILTVLATFESIESIAKLSYDESIEGVLTSHMDSLKKLSMLERELTLEKLKKADLSNEDQFRANISPLLTDLGVAPDAITITKNTVPADDSFWQDSNTLVTPLFTAKIPNGHAFKLFNEADEVKKRYTLLGDKLNTQIKPTLTNLITGVQFITFIVLVFLIALLARRFRRRILIVTEGMATWSHSDPAFRLSKNLSGELQLIAEQFNNMADEVETNRARAASLEKIAAWQIIARKLAHEIKNPLTPIQMMASQLKRRYKGDDKSFSDLLTNAEQIITQEVHGLRRMVDSFSEFARLPEPDLKNIDLAQVLIHATELEKTAFPNHKITLELITPPLQCKADEVLLRQVIINLVKNAAEAALDPPSSISVVGRKTKTEVIVTVTDTGPGIPPEIQTKIFEAYFTTKTSSGSTGMGLGLAVCQKIVLDHNGRLDVQSKPGDTTFTIRIPV